MLLRRPVILLSIGDDPQPMIRDRMIGLPLQDGRVLGLRLGLISLLVRGVCLMQQFRDLGRSTGCRSTARNASLLGLLLGFEFLERLRLLREQPHR